MKQRLCLVVVAGLLALTLGCSSRSPIPYFPREYTGQVVAQVHHMHGSNMNTCDVFFADGKRVRVEGHWFLDVGATYHFQFGLSDFGKGAHTIETIEYLTSQ